MSNKSTSWKSLKAWQETDYPISPFLALPCLWHKILPYKGFVSRQPLRAHVQVECLVDVIDELVSSDDPQDKLQRFTKALHEVFVFGRSTKHMIQRQLGRLEPTPALKYRAHEVMRNMPVMST